MFALDPARAASEIRRVLRPGGRRRDRRVGRRASATRGSGVVFDAVSAQIGAPVPPPGIPGPFALGDADGSRGLLDDAGLADVEVDELRAVARRVFDEWWTRTSALAGPLATILASHPEAAVGRCASPRARRCAPTRPRRAGWTSRA